MDRHICRAKIKGTNEWIYGYYVKHNTVQVCVATDDPRPKHYIVSDGSACDWGFEPPLQVTEIDPNTLGMCTDLFDRHKTKIFENDIVEFIHSNSSSRYLIWWCREGSMMTAVPLDGIYFNGYDYGNVNYPNFNYETFCLMMQDPWGDFKDIRVIGNIHDNPDLLSECKNYGTEVLPNGRF